LHITQYTCMYILQFSEKPFMIKVLGKETWVEKKGEGKGNRLLILKLCNTAVPTNKSEAKRKWLNFSGQGKVQLQ